MTPTTVHLAPALATAKPARTVVHRHPCDCATASRPLAAGEEAEHRLDVDGAPFPWYIAEEGVTFTRGRNLFLVSLRVIPFVIISNEFVEFRHSFGGQPTLGDRPFPWALAATEVVWRHVHGDLPTLALTFLAESVDTDGPINEHPSGAEIRDLAGSLYQPGTTPE